MSNLTPTAGQLAVFCNNVLSAVAGYESSHIYSGCVRKDFSLGGFVLSEEIRDGLVLAANNAENKQILLFSERETAERFAAILHSELEKLSIGPNCYVEAAPVRDSRETVTKAFVFTKKRVELVKMYMLHVSLSW